jgi:hypothetical protein
MSLEPCGYGRLVKTLAQEREALIRWIADEPTYRVDFWTAVSPSDPDRGIATGWKRDAYYVTEADADEVLAWSEADGRRAVVYVVFARGEDEPGLIRLAGLDPTIPTTPIS